MGSSPSKSRYNYSNLVLEYQFSLKKPSNNPRIPFIEGESLFEFDPDHQNEILIDLERLISDGDNKTANTYRKYKKLNNITKILISLAITLIIGYIAGAIFEYLPLLSILWILISTLIFITSTSLALYLLFFAANARDKYLNRWRQSIITKISTKLCEWQTKSKSFSFTLCYPIHDISYGRKNKIVDVRGIIRITFGNAKFVSKKEPIYFQLQAAPNSVAIERHSHHRQETALKLDEYDINDDINDQGDPISHIHKTAISRKGTLPYKKISIKRHHYYQRERALKLERDASDKISLISEDHFLRPKLVNDPSNKTSISIAVEVDKNGNVQNNNNKIDDESIGGVTMSRRASLESKNVFSPRNFINGHDVISIKRSNTHHNVPLSPIIISPMNVSPNQAYLL